MMTLNYSITKQEYKSFCHFIGWLNPDRKTDRVKHYLIGYGGYVGILTLIFILSDIPLDPLLLILLSVAAILWYFFSELVLKRHFYKLGAKLYNDSYKENYALIIRESGMIIKGKDTDAHYNWSAFVKKYETPSAYYLYMSNNIGLIIPKRVFDSAVQKESFEKILAEHLPLQASLPSVSN